MFKSDLSDHDRAIIDRERERERQEEQAAKERKRR
jgi:hypothetical protein